MTHLPRLATLLFALLVALPAGFAQSPAPRPLVAPAAVQPVTAKHGMVVAQEHRAAKIGADILERGGNAIDAAVAVGFAMAVT